MKTWTDIKILLANPLDESQIKYLEKGWSKKVPYLSGEFVKRTANSIFGEDGWSEESLDVNHVAPRAYDSHGKPMFACVAWATTKLAFVGYDPAGTDGQHGDEHPITRVGHGSCIGIASAPEEAIETARKGAATDAFKRAMVAFGDSFGLCLYDKDYIETLTPPNVPAKPAPAETAAHKCVGDENGYCITCGEIIGDMANENDELPPDIGQGVRGGGALPKPTAEQPKTGALLPSTCAACGGELWRDWKGTPYRTSTGKLYVKCKDKKCNMAYAEDGYSWKVGAKK